jgi:hypothetical protein
MRHVTDQRGLGLVEMLVAVFAGSFVLLAIGSFYVSMTRFSRETNTQAAIQRQGTLLQQELGRVILPASGLLAGACGPPSGTTASLPIQVLANALPEIPSGGFVCIYRNASVISECRFTDLTNTTCIANTSRNLLLGASTHDAVQASALTFTLLGNSVVDISFSLVAAMTGVGVTTPVTFGARYSIRN